MVKTKDKKSIDNEGVSKKINSQQSHLGSLMISHSKKMNDFILALDGFKNRKTYYGYTDSVYVHYDDYEILKSKGLIGKILY